MTLLKQTVKDHPNSIQMSLILRWRPPNPCKVSRFLNFESLLHGLNLTTESQTW